MSKRVEIDGQFFRVRRQRLVDIPEQWVGEVSHPQTIRKRRSKQIRRLRDNRFGKTGYKRNEFKREEQKADPDAAELGFHI